MQYLNICFRLNELFIKYDKVNDNGQAKKAKRDPAKDEKIVVTKILIIIIN